jgi:hypothetical protein
VAVHTPVYLISTGADRTANIMIRNPFG